MKRLIKVWFVIRLSLLSMAIVACAPSLSTITPIPIILPPDQSSDASASPDQSDDVSTLPDQPDDASAYAFRLAPVDPSQTSNFWLEQAQETIQRRFEVEMTGPFTVSIDSEQLVVELSNATDAENARLMLGEPYTTIFFHADSPYAEGASVPPETTALLEGEYMLDAHAEQVSSDEWQVRLWLTSVGGRILDTFAHVNIGRYLMIAQDARVIRSLVISNSTIGGTGSIRVGDTLVYIVDNFTESTAKGLATQLNRSQLPIEMTLIESE